mmetsp:Transcript_56686/g.122503  ORF Transcript_56686/g.122503 Transcript_56686/m.122503 type:complete len:290 (+) Transcript_56686:1152-2021(+)
MRAANEEMSPLHLQGRAPFTVFGYEDPVSIDPHAALSRHRAEVSAQLAGDNNARGTGREGLRSADHSKDQGTGGGAAVANDDVVRKASIPEVDHATLATRSVPPCSEGDTKSTAEQRGRGRAQVAEVSRDAGEEGSGEGELRPRSRLDGHICSDLGFLSLKEWLGRGQRNAVGGKPAGASTARHTVAPERPGRLPNVGGHQDNAIAPPEAEVLDAQADCIVVLTGHPAGPTRPCTPGVAGPCQPRAGAEAGLRHRGARFLCLRPKVVTRPGCRDHPWRLWRYSALSPAA